MYLERTIFAFFPYLYMKKGKEERVNIRGIEFRSNQDIDGLTPDVQYHLKTLSQMFFLQDGLRIEQMTCAILELPSDDKDKVDDTLLRLYEAHLLIGYMYSYRDHDPSEVCLPYECSTLFIFWRGGTIHQEMVWRFLVWLDPEIGQRVKRVDDRKIPSEPYIPGYTGIMNRSIRLHVAEGSRIFPEIPLITLNHFQSLSHDRNQKLKSPDQWALRDLFDHQHDYLLDLRKRVFVSMEWYLKSCRTSALFYYNEAIVHLATALESLLHIRADLGVTERFKDAIVTLLGQVPNLNFWLDQFYKAKSKAVHEGETSNPMFNPFGDSEKEKQKINKSNTKNQEVDEEPVSSHRTLLYYGRLIFRLCLAGVLDARARAHYSGLHQLLIPNKQRIDEIFKVLNEEKLPPDMRLQSARKRIFELCNQPSNLLKQENLSLEASLDAIIGCVKEALRVYKDAVAKISEPLKEAIDNVSSSKGEPSSTLLEQLKTLLKEIEHFANKLQLESVSGEQNLKNSELTDIVIELLNYATNQTLILTPVFSA